MNRHPLRVSALLVALCLLLPALASGHTLKPGFLLLQEQDSGEWEMNWTAPGAEPSLLPVVRGRCSLERRAARWSLDCQEGEAPVEIVVPGLRRDSTEVVVRVAPLQGAPSFAVLMLGENSIEVSLEAAEQESLDFVGWLLQGFHHILEGLDHLLFVLGLVLLITGFRELLWTITSFTLAHSITLGGASLGAFSLPSAPVEATIALSIVLLAVEVCSSEETITRRRPWLVAFAFGLLHGFGFAGALGDIGLPEGQVWMPLLSFNLGVELGQLAFVAVVIGPVLLLRKAPDWARKIPAYGIGTVAAAWTIERVLGFFGGA